LCFLPLVLTLPCFIQFRIVEADLPEAKAHSLMERCFGSLVDIGYFFRL
jgi:hypothetical protein